MADEEQVPGSEPVDAQQTEAPVEITSDIPKDSEPAAYAEETGVSDPSPVFAATEVPATITPVEADASAPALDPVAIATELARARAAALAAQFTAGHGGVGVDAETTKRFREFEDDENAASKRMNSEQTMSFLASVGAGGENNEILHIPSGKVGKLIGKGGSTIKDIQARGGARVKIDHESTGENRMLTIIGAPDQITLTKKYIFETIESTDSHAGFGAPSPSAFGGAGAGAGSFASMGAPGVAGEDSRKISCPAHIVGRIIGRGGETIRSLQTASNARIAINQNFPEGHPREIDINGAPESVARAHEMVMEIINSDGNASTQTVIQKFGQGITKEIECPKHMVGRIIGKGGETVKTLQRQFAASIQIDQNAVPCKVTIIGPPEAVMAAEHAVMALMDDRPQMGGHMGGHIGGFGAPRPSFGAPPFGAYGAAPYGGYGGAPGGYGGYPAPQHGYGGGYPGQAAPGGYGGYPAQPAYGGYPQPGAQGGYPGGADPYAAAGGYPGAAQQQQQQQATGAAAPAAAGASVWSEMKDDQNRSYYYNSQTGVSQWERPAEMQ